MSWFFISLAAPVLWGTTNHIDKYIISKFFSGKGVGSLVIFTSLSGFIFSLFILVFNFSVIRLSPENIIFISITGALLVASFIPYMHALEQEETSTVIPLFQLIPVFGYILARFFLNEQLNNLQIVASLLIIFGAIIISLDTNQTIRLKLKPFLLMTLSSFLIAFSAFIFKVVALKENFWGTAFWEYIGGALFGLFLFSCIKLYRQQFIATIMKNKSSVISASFLSEFLNIIAKLLSNFASLLAPLALVWVVNGFQPLVVFLYGVILTLFFPQWGSEKIGKIQITQKLIAIVIIFIGGYLLVK